MVQFGGKQRYGTVIVFRRCGGGGQSQAFVRVSALCRDPVVPEWIAFLNRIRDPASPFPDDSHLFDARLLESFGEAGFWLGQLCWLGGCSNSSGESEND